MSSRERGNRRFSLRQIFLQFAHRNNIESPNIPDVESGRYKSPRRQDVEPSAGLGSFVARAVPPKHDISLCSICYTEEGEDNFFLQLQLCNHKFCMSCLKTYLRTEISESRTDIDCPQCSTDIHSSDIERVLNTLPDVKAKYEQFSIRRYLITDPDSRWCPAPDCNFAVIANGCASCPQIQCLNPDCGISFCYHCKAEWHPDQTCDAAKNSRRKISENIGSQELLDSKFLRSDDVKPCPRCQVLIVKMNDGSCNHMSCSICGTEFCWLCMKEVTDLHYLSPSGCTFWGKKPWSRKKKIVWQIGTLIGAPIGIALLAGIAVPSIVIGVPVWATKKILIRYKFASKRKRILAIVLGAVSSILISPVLAALAIAIGVPILLFYIYGIVPVSLIRASCETASSENSGVNYDIDENASTGNNSTN